MIRSALTAFSLLALALPNLAEAQVPRGTDLYDLMGAERLTQTDGSANLSWLPGARGYYSRSMGTVTVYPA